MNKKQKNIIWLIIIGSGLLFGVGLFFSIGLNDGFSWFLAILCLIGGILWTLTYYIGWKIGNKIQESKYKKLNYNKPIEWDIPKDLFIPCNKRTGSYYFEFQYCKKQGSVKYLTNNGYGYWIEDSILVHVHYMEEFFENYGLYLMETNAPNGTNKFYEYGVNYYTKEQTKVILDKIKETKPKDYEIIVDWLEKAINEYNGFYFMGI